jgi:glycosyltransferase involved in cell wall biosynthesis
MIQRAISSALAQTVHAEIIVIDDGSSNNDTILFLDQFASEHPDIILVHKENGGASSARNVGLDIASGVYIAFLDADDELMAGYFENALKILEDSGANATFGGYLCESPNGMVEDYRQKDVEVDGYYLVQNNEMQYFKESIYIKNACKFMGLKPRLYSFIWGALFQAELIRKIRFDETLDLGEDRLFNFMVSNAAQTVALAGGAWYKVYENYNSASRGFCSDYGDKLIKTAKVITSLHDNNSFDLQIKQLLYFASITCFADTLYHAMKCKVFNDVMHMSRVMYVKKLLSEPVYAKALKLAKPPDLDYRILFSLARNGKVRMLILCYDVHSIIGWIKRRLKI